MEPKRRGSRTYAVKMDWDKMNPPIVVEKGLSYRTACKLLDNLERTWKQMGSKVVRDRAKIVLGEGEHELVVWFEEDKHAEET